MRTLQKGLPRRRRGLRPGGRGDGPLARGRRRAHVRRGRRVPAEARRGGRAAATRPAARVAVVPAWQGRVMTSATGGAAGARLRLDQRRARRLGAAAAAHQRLRRRGPALARPRGRAVLDLLREGRRLRPRALADARRSSTPSRGPSCRRTRDRATFRQRGRLVNYSGTPLDVELERTVRLLSRDDAAEQLGGALPASVRLVAFASENTLVNAGQAPWTQGDGRAVAVDPRHVPAVAADDDRRPLPRPGPESRARAGRERRLLRQGAGRPPASTGTASSSSAATAGTAARSASRPAARGRSSGSYDAAREVLTLVDASTGPRAPSTT